ncbi:hypothetical protein QM806_27935 [Rhodococcus sp. IEGM 1351]|uniref:hypothetical protein n=1 Tax=Rhodococcus sp. IEGM 1351 TaxID=3047089 RepID=UPI0024B6B728|nr:hypothetical protein [Rhodococcus sp. IEGM 1351]MDI9939218.1 hypothetical protein [Rhodococcus sp. IEGM 1351]
MAQLKTLPPTDSGDVAGLDLHVARRAFACSRRLDRRIPVEGDGKYRSYRRAFGLFVVTTFSGGVVIGLARSESPFVVSAMISLVVLVSAQLVVASSRNDRGDH